VDIRKLLDEFDEQAQDWGYIQSEGWEPDLSEAEQKYTQVKKKLLDGIEALEKLAGLIPATPPSSPSVLRRKINW